MAMYHMHQSDCVSISVFSLLRKSWWPGTLLIYQSSLGMYHMCQSDLSPDTTLALQSSTAEAEEAAAKVNALRSDHAPCIGRISNLESRQDFQTLTLNTKH